MACRQSQPRNAVGHCRARAFAQVVGQLPQIGDTPCRQEEHSRGGPLRERAGTSVADRIARLRLSTHHAASVLQAREPSAQIAAAKNRLVDLTHRQTRAVEAGLTRRRQHQTRTAHALELLGPRQTLERGFTMTLDTARRPLTSAHKARREEKIVTVFADGEIVSRPDN
ncbi:MAG: exodeoxyribonuclease VII large subunit [Chthoniobacterales bacterium]